MESFRSMLLDNLPQKALALALAVTLVSVKRDDELADGKATVRVRVNKPDDRVLVSSVIEKVTITVEGKKGRIREVDLQELPDLELSLTGLEGGQVTFEANMFRIPRGLRVRTIRPAAMIVQFEEKATREIPVEVVFGGEPASGLRVASFTVEPPKVTIEGAKSSVEALARAKTLPIDLTGLSESTIRMGRLNKAPEHVGFLGPHQFQVAITVEEKTGTRVIAGVPIEVRGVAEGHPGFEVNPDKVEITLNGPVRLLLGVKAGALAAHVDVSNIKRKSKKRLHTLDVAFESPDGLQSSELKPHKVTVAPREPKPPDAGVEGPDGGID